MKSLVPAFFLIVYVAVLFQPLYPLVDYLLHKDYITKTYCENKTKVAMHCNGKCHLMKQIKKAAEDTPRNPVPRSTSENLLPHFAFACYSFQAFPPDLLRNINSIYNCSYSEGYSQSLLRPPSCA